MENTEGMYAKYRRKRQLLEKRFRVFITPPPPASPPGDRLRVFITPPPPASPPGEFEPAQDDNQSRERDQTPTENHTNAYNGISPIQLDNNLHESNRDLSPVEIDRPNTYKDTDDGIEQGHESPPPLAWRESRELENHSGKQTPEVATDEIIDEDLDEEEEISTSSLTKNDQTAGPENSGEGENETIREQSPEDKSFTNRSEDELIFDETTSDNETHLLKAVNENEVENQDSEIQNESGLMQSISEEDMENVSVTGTTEIESAKLEENNPNDDDFNQLKSDSQHKAETPPNMKEP